MQKPEPCLSLHFQFLPIATHRVQQPLRPENIRGNERLRGINRPVDMLLGSKVQNGIDLMLTQQLGNQCSAPDVSLDKDMPLIAIQIRE